MGDGRIGAIRIPIGSLMDYVDISMLTRDVMTQAPITGTLRYIQLEHYRSRSSILNLQ